MSSARTIAITGWLLLATAGGLAASASAARPGAPGLPAAQAGTVTGVVTDAQTNRPLAGAQVMAEGTSIGTLTDQAGRFRLAGLSGAQITIRVQMLGFRPATQTASVGATEVRIALRQTAIELDAVVVTGTAGGTQARAVGNSVAAVSAEELMEKAPVTNVQSVLSGRVAGVNVMSSTGNVGSGGVTRIRGMSTISLTSEPLIYVDGVRVNNSTQAGPSGMRESRPASRINDFNPDDIESIEVIKGPAAATLYGTEASNGVIQIITKKGKTGAPQFDFTVKQGVNFFMDAEERFPNGYVRDRATGQILVWNAVKQEKELGILDGGIFTNGPVRSYGGSLSGGTDRIRYYMAGDYDYAQGAVNYNWDRKVSGRANLNAMISEEFDLSANFGFVRGETRFAQQLSPYGVWDGVVWGHAARQRNLNGVEQRGWYTAPPEEIAKVEAFSNNDRFTGGLTANWTPFEWLAQRLTVGADVGSEVNTRLVPRQLSGSSHFFGELALGDKRVENVRPTFTTFEYTATGTANLPADLKAATSFGFQHYSKRSELSEATGRIFPVPSVESVGGAAITFGGEDIIENKTLGMFIQEQLDWRNRVFLTAAVRGDDNSAFGENYDFVVYPKFSASWVINEEPFWNLGWVNTLKLRGAWGQAGQQPDVFAAVRLFDPVTGPGDASVLTPSSVGNPDLKPEVGTELELGFDAGILDDRVSLMFSWYDQSTTDAIVSRTVAPSSGFTGTQFVNAGELTNSGVELTVNAQMINRPRFGLDMGWTHSTNKNKLVSLGGLPESFGDYTAIQEGYPLNGYWAVQIVSAELNAEGRPINIMCKQPEGDPLPCAQSAPKLYLGPQTPQWEGAVHSTLSLLGNLQLYANVEYKGGYHRADGDVGFAHMLQANTQAMQGYVDGRGPDPIALAYGTQSGTWGKTMWMHEADFARLREVSASYTLPSRFASRFGASQVTINTAARNLWFLYRKQTEIFDHPIVDPETRGKGESAGQTQTHLPPLTSIVTTIRVRF